MDKISYRRRVNVVVDDGAYHRLHLISLRKAELRSQAVINFVQARLIIVCYNIL